MERYYSLRLTVWRSQSHSLLLLLGWMLWTGTLLFTLWLVVSCGVPTASPAPSGYLWTDQTTLVYITWHTDHSVVSGQLTDVSYASTAFPASTQPDATTQGYIGHLTMDGTLTLQTGVVLFGGTIIGKQSVDQQTLLLHATNTGTGQSEPQKWVAVTPSQEAALLTAFNAYEVVQGILPAVQQDVHQQASPPADLNAPSVEQARQAVQREQTHLTTIQHAPDETTQCQEAADFIPLNPSTFTLWIEPQHLALVRDLATLDRAWKTAQPLPIPRIATLSSPVSRLPWYLSSQTYTSQMMIATRDVAILQQDYHQDEDTMHQLQQQDQSIQRTVQAISASCPSS